MDARKLAGREAEAQCAKFLRSKGYEILSMNYTCRGGEIDIVAAQRTTRGIFRRTVTGYIAFVEVKQRTSRAFGEAREAVDRRKQQRIKLAAKMYLSEHDTELQPRFDVMEVYPGDGGPVINHIENAFE